MKTPSVSFVIPAYNAARTLGRALDCLVAQDMPDWEAIIVDDGSRDRTRHVAQRYVAIDPRFQILRQANAGPSAARNTGIAAARGEWIAFLDADDWVVPNFLTTLLELAGHKAARTIPYCSYVRVTESGEHTPPDWTPELQTNAFEFLAHRCEPAIHALLLPRALVNDVGGFDVDLGNCEDWDLWLKLARSGAEFVGTPEPLAYYQMRAGSLSTDNTLADRASAIVMMRATKPDPRVTHPDPRYAEGLKSWSVTSWFSMYVGQSARAIAAGEPADLSWVAELAQPGTAHAFQDELREVATSAIEGYAEGARIALRDVELATACEALDPIDQAVKPYIAGFSEAWRFLLALCIIEVGPFSPPRIQGSWMARDVDTRFPLPPISPIAGVEAVMVGFKGTDAHHPRIELPALYPITPSDIADAYIPLVRSRDLFRMIRAPLRPAFWLKSLTSLVSGLTTREQMLALRRSPGRTMRLSVRDAFHVGARAALGAAPAAQGDELSQQARNAGADFLKTARLPSEPLHQGWREPFDMNEDREAYWEEIFAKGDPWTYDNAYESVKYDRTIGLVPKNAKNVLELACAEGHFTARLAPLVEHLTATDISTTALKRASERCADQKNIAFSQLDFFNSPIEGQYDLIVCSEVLYFTEEEERLRNVLEKISAALEIGGSFVTAHAYVIDDSKNRSGFDWGDRIGADAIRRVMDTIPDVVLAEEIETELYRIARYVRIAGDAKPPEIKTLALDLGCELDVQLEADVVWGGASLSRIDVQDWATDSLPILLLGDVVDERERHQQDAASLKQLTEILRFLRRGGFSACTLAEYRQARIDRSSFFGRPVALVFTDRSGGFAERVLPVIERSGFKSELMLTSDRLTDPAQCDHLRALQNRSVGLGYVPAPLPISPAARLDAAGIAASALTGIFGCPSATALSPYDGMDSVLLRKADFDVILQPSLGLASSTAVGNVVPALSCGAADTVGMLAELLRESARAKA